MIGKLLVALDGSELSEAALWVARGLAAKTRAELVLYTAIDAPSRWASDSDDLREAEETAAGIYLDSLQAQLADEGVRVRTSVGRGRAATAICEAALAESADAIVLASHGRSGLGRWALGSVADKVLQIAEAPVFVVRAGTAVPERDFLVQHILAPLDGSERAERALPGIIDLARQLDASLTLFRAVPPPALLYADAWVPSHLPMLEEIEDRAADYLAEQAKRAVAAGVRVRRAVGTGVPALAILEEAEREKADLIALSTHGRTGPARWVLGSVADAVIRHSGRVCLVIPARAVEPVEGAGEAAGSAPAVVVPPPQWSEVPMSRQRPPVKKAPVREERRPERKPGM